MYFSSKVHMYIHTHTVFLLGIKSRGGGNQLNRRAVGQVMDVHTNHHKAPLNIVPSVA